MLVKQQELYVYTFKVKRTLPIEYVQENEIRIVAPTQGYAEACVKERFDTPKVSDFSCTLIDTHQVHYVVGVELMGFCPYA